MAILSTSAMAFTEKNDETFFNFQENVKKFESIGKNLSSDVNSISLSQAVAYVKALDGLQDSAKRCVALSESKVKSIDELLKSNGIDGDFKLEQADYKYLKDKKAFYVKHLSECRFFVYRSQESLVEYKRYVQALSAKRLLKRNAPLWKIDQNIKKIGTLSIIFSLSMALLLSVWLGLRSTLFSTINQRRLLKHTTLIIVITVLLGAILGFHALSFFIITNLWWTIGAFLVAYGLWYGVNGLYRIADDKKYWMYQAIRRALGIKFYKPINEILLLAYIGYFVIFCMFSVSVLYIWGGTANLIDSIVDGLLDGFTLGGVTIVPLYLVYGLLAFSIILLMGRYFCTYLARKKQFSHKGDAQVAMASITFYLFFSLAVLMALLIMGINFTGLAIIAGALSVGAGLGLQEIVNNFVSGIVLLLEKPIKSGDRVVVGGVEGFVKKIRLRSTQITTLAMEDVMVPNAELISNKVTNYMFRDAYWRIVCKVGVAYGSDTEQVKKTLLAVAALHPDVIQEQPNEPVVLFRGFGDSSLTFELWCIIEDVNKKFMVVSDLNFAIDAAFRKEKITIAFPQRDLHIKHDRKKSHYKNKK